jgi:uncharacterized membrane protein
MFEKILLVLLVTWSPVAELRGGIPLGLSLGLDPILTLIIAIVANSILFLPVFGLLDLLYKKFLYKVKIFNSYLEWVRQRKKPWVDKYGFLGLTLFVAIPLPTSGVYTGTTLSWLLGMDWKRAYLAVGLGVILAGVVVLLAALGIITALQTWF